MFRADSVGTRYRVREFFDAIICDPPYGIRAGVREVKGKGSTIKNKKKEYIIPTKKTTCEIVTNKLFNLSR